MKKVTKIFISIILNNIIFFAIFFSVWLIFSGSINKISCILGIVSSIFCIAILSYFRVLQKPSISFFSICYIFVLMKNIFLSAINVTKLIWKENFSANPVVGIVKFKSLDNRKKIVMHAEAITMTPGTIVIGVNKNEMLVHFIDKENYSDKQDHLISYLVGK